MIYNKLAWDIIIFNAYYLDAMQGCHHNHINIKLTKIMDASCFLIKKFYGYIE